ncbi:AAA family ATPase [Chondromyces apiculatus]|uniref:AAA-ATPase-like domain-containing protein n=1 Tax=Chondromyces apiculatus DSM 436 TaxID=1192034 RepID=A0A017SYQ4_9BACT|nr:AAA family ATPase [Chondromyces apiculatus]EYF01912.1 Hypothetical protein CAP_7680 [Chondromyces apiculatus DSM 436]
MPLRLAIGTSDFRKLRESGAYYIDKTSFIREILDAPAEVILLPRPRRFGKTMNLSMLRAYLERREPGDDDLAPLFAGLSIASADPEVRAHQQRYPVVHLNLKGVKASTFDDACKALGRVLAVELERHAPLVLADPRLLPTERHRYEALMASAGAPVDLWDALALLTRLLHRATRERALVLIDEYDVPLQAGFTHGYLDEVTGLMRNLLTGGLKDNPHLFRGVLTGVLRVAREGIFSGPRRPFLSIGTPWRRCSPGVAQGSPCHTARRALLAPRSARGAPGPRSLGATSGLLRTGRSSARRSSQPAGR